MAKRRGFKRARARTITRSAPRRVSRRRSSGGRGGWLPLSNRDMLLDFGVGAITPTVNRTAAGLIPSGLTNWAGNYADEVRIALIGAAAHKLGSGIVKDAGREMFRYAVLSAGQETGAKFLNGNGTSNGGGNGVVMA